MVVARSSEMIDRIKILALHGMSKDAWHRFGDEGYKHYEVVEAGFKYNMMDLQAALGIHQLRRVEKNWLRRREILDSYQQAFSGLSCGRPADPDEHMRHAYHLYTLTIDEQECGMSRDSFIDRMDAAGIGVGVHYRSLAQQPYYQNEYGWRPGDYPVAQAFGERTVSLPLGPKLDDAEVNRIIETVTTIL